MDILKSFPEQFSWEPNIEGGELAVRSETIVGGMGGSLIPAHLLKSCDEALGIRTHNNFGLPKDVSEDAVRCVAVSYSGETEETNDFADEAWSRGFPLGVVTDNEGTLLSFAHKHNVPYVILPGGLPPRFGLGYQARALAALLGAESAYRALGALAGSFGEGSNNARDIAAGLSDEIPLVYASKENESVSYLWKTFFNETAKVPAFANVLPELAHNELQMFDGECPASFHVLLLRDAEDHPRIIERMDVLQEVLEEKGVSVTALWLTGENRFEKVFGGAYLGMQVSYAFAEARGADPLTQPLIDSFKDSLNS